MISLFRRKSDYARFLERLDWDDLDRYDPYSYVRRYSEQKNKLQKTECNVSKDMIFFWFKDITYYWND